MLPYDGIIPPTRQSAQPLAGRRISCSHSQVNSFSLKNVRFRVQKTEHFYYLCS